MFYLVCAVLLTPPQKNSRGNDLAYIITRGSYLSANGVTSSAHYARGNPPIQSPLVPIHVAVQTTTTATHLLGYSQPAKRFSFYSLPSGGRPSLELVLLGRIFTAADEKTTKKTQKNSGRIGNFFFLVCLGLTVRAGVRLWFNSISMSSWR